MPVASKPAKLIRLSRLSWVKLRATAVVLAVVALGYIITRTFAAGPLAAIEVEAGALSGGAQVVVQTGASGGSIVRFVAPTPAPVASTPVPATPTPRPATPTPVPTPVPAGNLTAADLTRLAQYKIYFAHQSVGGNIMQGVPEVYTSFGVSGLNLTGGSTSGAGGFFADTSVGANGNPTGKISDFNSKIRGGVGGQVGIAFFKFCYVDIMGGTDVTALFNQYRSTMDALAASYPGVKFIHVTNPLTTTDNAANYARERFNQLVRAQYGSSGRLFDLAKVESTQPGGARVSGTYNGNTFYALYSGYTTDGGHLNAAGRQAAAKELLTVIANATR